MRECQIVGEGADESRRLRSSTDDATTDRAMAGVRLLVVIAEGGFVLTANERRRDWKVTGAIEATAPAACG